MHRFFFFNFLKYIYYITIVIISLGITYSVTKFIVVDNIVLFILKGFLTVIVSTLSIVLFTFKTKEFKEIFNLIKGYCNKKLKRL